MKIVIIIGVLLIILIVLLSKYTNKHERILFLASNRYLKSHYVIQYVNNNYYRLKNTRTNHCVDLDESYYEWDLNDTLYYRCRGTFSECMKVFNKLHPIIEDIKTIKQL